MRLGVHRNAVIRTTWPRSRHTQSFRHFTYTSRSHSISPDPPIRETPNPNARNIAILGGGVTGLATAWNLTKRIPDAKITLYEKNDRLGGWVGSEQVQVKDGDVLFEWGPRTLRPALTGAGRATVDLLLELGLSQQVIPISKRSPAALNRFIYYPDHLVLMPGPVSGVWDGVQRLMSLWSEPIHEGVVSGLLGETFVSPRGSDVEDESVGHFLRRRFGKNIADNIASAFFHGVYAGDLYQLSARTLLSSAWFLEGDEPRNELGVLLQMILQGLGREMLIPGRMARYLMMEQHEQSGKFEPKLEALKSLLRRSSVYTFKRGLGELTTSLESALARNPNVMMLTSSQVKSVGFDRNEKCFQVDCSSQPQSAVDIKYDYVVSTLGPNVLRDSLLETDGSVSSACVNSNRAVSVMVVNLYYSNPNLIPPSHTGFGYLIPRSVPYEQNPERALGVIFGSETSGNSREAREEKLRYMIESLELENAARQNKDNNPVDVEQHKQDGNVDSRNDSSVDEASNRIEKLLKEFDQDCGQGQDTAPGTKITVMMGGHWWTGWKSDELPSEKEAIEMAQSLLKRQLGITEEPEVAKARLNRNCIPQYTVGYHGRMNTIHEALVRDFQGRFKVAGPWWQGGVGLNDCVQKARETAWSIQHQWDDKTGLEDVVNDQDYHRRDPAS
ncbi:protoporphyrinogen oxidase [Exophiala spinifera]|uniref:Protoporphyrinogen oxidase n=1 Tax=Exophiala spinifera TaxID=91928 RepID=A0A0D2B6Z4_9EURO|nr:protoporphyrinogen oxidase [Exophiala spinifera]KIW14445.1 protoporphyrinogen oxidase [Exophiala spinifera]